MSVGDSLRKNLQFWHWYPRLLCEGLSEDQLHWQPENHPNHMMFAMWHAYRSEDDIIHGILMRRPSIFARDGWAKRLPVAEPGNPPFGTGLNREQIAAVRLHLDDLLEYAEAVAASLQEYVDGLNDDEGAEQIPLPFFAPIYPMLDSMSRAEVLAFFCIGHTAEHLGEVQYIKGLLGLTGAPM
jgi:DinB superfamily